MTQRPILDTPITRMTEHWFHLQGTRCADLEEHLVVCASRVGAQHVGKECHKELADFKECALKRKQVERYMVMQSVRKAKGLPFEPAPLQDIFQPLQQN